MYAVYVNVIISSAWFALQRWHNNRQHIYGLDMVQINTGQIAAFAYIEADVLAGNALNSRFSIYIKCNNY